MLKVNSLLSQRQSSVSSCSLQCQVMLDLPCLILRFFKLLGARKLNFESVPLASERTVAHIPMKRKHSGRSSSSCAEAYS